MKTTDFAALARIGKTDIVSAAIRFKAARKFSGLGQEDLATAAGRTVSNISNMERARSFPALEAIMVLWNNHRVDANFIIAGHFSQLPSDVVPGLMDALADVTASTDLLTGSARPRKTG